jgi:dynein heavy chain
VQPFLKKVFEAINMLEFQPDLEVTAMISEEGEKEGPSRHCPPRHRLAF